MQKLLRRYQDEDRGKAIQALLAGQERVVLWWGTGLGKSLEAKVIASEILRSKGNPFTHILIVAPQTTIVEQFDGQESYRRLDGSESETAEITTVTSSTTQQAFKVLERFLTDPKKSGILVVTHQLFRKSFAVLLNNFREGSNRKLLLIPDEKHHAAIKGTDLGELETGLINLGSTASLGLTATNFRADGKPVNTREITWNEYTSGTYRDGSPVSLKDTLVLEQPLTKMMLTGFAPDSLETELVQSDNVNLRDLTDFERDQGMTRVRVKGLAQEIVNIWIRHGRVPTLIRYSCCRPKCTNEELRDALREAFKREGVSIVDAIGDGGDEELIEVIREEKSKEKPIHYADIKPVIVAIQRATEGMDSPCRCLGISVGIPQSEVLAAQLPGRLMRLRLRVKLNESGMRDYSEPAVPAIPGYPEDWQTKSKQVFITAPQEENSPYLKGLLSTLAIMAGLSNISMIIGVFKKCGILNKLNQEGVAEQILKNQISNEEAIRADRLVALAIQWWRSVTTEDDVPFKAIRKIALARVYENLRDIPEFEESGQKYSPICDRAIREAFLRLLIKSNNDLRVEEFLTSTTLAKDPDNPAYQEELEALCEEFELETQSDSLHDFGAIDAVYWGSKFESIVSKDICPRSMNDIAQYYDNFSEHNDKLPDIRDKLTPTSTRTFDTCHSFLMRGVFGVVYAGGLRQWAIERAYGSSWRKELDKWTEHDRELVEGKAEAFRDSYGKMCPVYKYLRRLVGKKLPKDLTLEQACILASGESNRTRSSRSIGATP